MNLLPFRIHRSWRISFATTEVVVLDSCFEGGTSPWSSGGVQTGLDSFTLFSTIHSLVGTRRRFVPRSSGAGCGGQMKLWSAFLLGLLFGTGETLAQSDHAGIAGPVTGVSGGIIAGARVIAANTIGATHFNPACFLNLPIAGPAVWHRWWFVPVCVMICAAAVLGLHRLRIYQMSQKLHLRFEERLAERTRVAQELTIPPDASAGQQAAGFQARSPLDPASVPPSPHGLLPVP